MNLKTKLAASLLMVGSTSMAQAAIVTYNFDALFNEPMISGTTLSTDTRAVGTLVWDTSAQQVQSMTVRMNESMAGSWVATGQDYVDPTDFAVNPNNYMLNMGTGSGTVVDNGTQALGARSVTAFLRNDTVVFDMMGSGAAVSHLDSPFTMMNTHNPGNDNAFFTLPFMVDSATGEIVTGSWMATGQATPSPWATADEWVNQNMAYGDCTAGSLMGGGTVCMAGDYAGSSMMAGSNQSLSITAAASPVPVPAAAWLFGGALMSLFGANRRKKVLPA